MDIAKDEFWSIFPGRENDLNWIIRSLVTVIFFEALSKPMSLDANDRIRCGIEIGRPFKNFECYVVLCGLRTSILKRFSA